MNQPITYHDYVIKNGKFVGDFEGLYLNHPDPWRQDQIANRESTVKFITTLWCNRLKTLHDARKTMELGCGFGYLTESLRLDGFDSTGMDTSSTAIAKAKLLNPKSNFIEGSISDFDLIKSADPDIVIMAEVTWYILDELDALLANFKQMSRARQRSLYVIHLLTTYAPGVQEYGTEKFTNLSEILEYFDLNYLESGLIQAGGENSNSSQATYFVAKID